MYARSKYNGAISEVLESRMLLQHIQSCVNRKSLLAITRRATFTKRRPQTGFEHTDRERI